MGKALLSKLLIQLFADEWGSTLSLLVVWPEATQPWGLQGSMVGLMVTSKRPYTDRTFQDHCFHCSSPCGEPLLTHVSTGNPPTLIGCFGSISCEVTAPFLWVLVHARFCALQDWSPCFPQSCGRPIIKSHRPSRSNSLGIPSPFVGSPGYEA